MSIPIRDIKDPSFLKSLSVKELEELAGDIRNFLIESVSKTEAISPAISASSN